MKKRKGVDLNNLTIIDESKFPEKRVRYTPYREILQSIPKGKAVVISDEEISVDTLRAGVRRLQKKGEFTKILIRSTKGVDGIKRVYLLNPSENQSEYK